MATPSGVWATICQSLGAAAEEAERVIGPCVKRNAEAWSELDALLQMHSQFCAQNAELEATATSMQETRSSLLHAPNRSMVLQELRMLFGSLEDDVRPLLDERERRAFDFVGSDQVERPSSALSLSGRSTAASISDKRSREAPLSSLRHIEARVSAVRELFDREHRDLLARIATVNSSLEEEADFQSEQNHRRTVLEPSTSDLQRLVAKLRRVGTLSKPEVKVPRSARVHKLRSLVNSHRPQTPLQEILDEREEPKSVLDIFFESPFD